MKKVTLDTNCIIDLEENRASAPDIKTLISMHDASAILLRLPAISASEKKKDGTFTSNFSEFKAKITAVGLGHVDFLKPLAYFGIAFWDWCVFSGPELERLERGIHGVLFPQIDFEYAEFCKKWPLDPESKVVDERWRNAKCDVLAMWSHINYLGDMFVTNDGNFHKESKKPQLISLGAGQILSPADAVAELRLSVR